MALDGIGMMFKSMGFDPKKMIEDIEAWKKQTVEILQAIKTNLLIIIQGQEKHTQQLNRIEEHLQQNAIQHQKAIGMLENNHNEIMNKLNTLGELWKEQSHPLSQIPPVHTLPQQQPVPAEQNQQQ